jgi:hypothetical protein
LVADFVVPLWWAMGATIPIFAFQLVVGLSQRVVLAAGGRYFRPLVAARSCPEIKQFHNRHSEFLGDDFHVEC